LQGRAPKPKELLPIHIRNASRVAPTAILKPAPE